MNKRQWKARRIEKRKVKKAKRWFSEQVRVSVGKALHNKILGTLTKQTAYDEALYFSQTLFSPDEYEIKITNWSFEPDAMLANMTMLVTPKLITLDIVIGNDEKA